MNYFYNIVLEIILRKELTLIGNNYILKAIINIGNNLRGFILLINFIMLQICIHCLPSNHRLWIYED